MNNEWEKIKDCLVAHNDIETREELFYISMYAWDRCGDINYDVAQETSLKGRPCYGGLDSSGIDDLSSFVLVFPPQKEGEPYKVKSYFFTSRMSEVGRSILNHFCDYSNPSWLITTAELRGEFLGLCEINTGLINGTETIIAKIEALNREYDIREIAIDGWINSNIINGLQESGIPIVQTPIIASYLNTPTKDLLRLILERRIDHGGNPILRWCIKCTKILKDCEGNIKPTRRNMYTGTNRAKGTFALIMALSRATAPYKKVGEIIMGEKVFCVDCNHYYMGITCKSPAAPHTDFVGKNKNCVEINGKGTCPYYTAKQTAKIESIQQG